MDNLILFNKVSLLPDNVKQEVSDFLDKLLEKSVTKIEQNSKSGFGSLRGKIIMHADFDEPLDCFKEYMPNE